MRNYARNAGLMALLFTPMLAACGQENSGGGGDFVSVPSCGQQGQVLSTDSGGQLICKDLPPGTVSLPNCKPDTEAVTSDGKALFCTNRNNDTAEARSAIDQLNKLEMDVIEYTTKINMLGGGGGAARPTYVGNTTNGTKGRITTANAKGLAAAAELCNAQYPGAKMCTVYDMYYSVVSGKITEAMTIPKSWVYQASWANPASANPTATSAAQEGDAGLNENCGSYHYDTADNRWVGTAVAWANMPYYTMAQEKGLKFFSGSAQGACNQTYPIACCK